MKNIFKPDYQNFEGVRPLNIYVLRIFFILMAFMMSYEAWTVILTHQGEWKPVHAVAWCTWAAYSTLSIFGIYNTLKMLPIMLFMIFYKSLWLIIVAYPLWKTNALQGSPAEGFMNIYIWVLVPFIFFPWKYFFTNYVVPTKKDAFR